MKLIVCLLAAVAFLGAGCAHPAAMGGAPGDNLEGYSSGYSRGQETAGQDYRQILSDPGWF